MDPIMLNAHWRVRIAPYPPPQWLLEYRRSATVRAKSSGWEAQSWCRTRHGLLVAINEKVVHPTRFYPHVSRKTGHVEQSVLDAIRDWPARARAFVERFGGPDVPEDDEGSVSRE